MIEGAVVVAAPLAAQVGPTMSKLSAYLGNYLSEVPAHISRQLPMKKRAKTFVEAAS